MYLTEFFTIAVLHALAILSPGPDFAIVIKQSVIYGRRTAILTALGVGAGIAIHVMYCLFGVAVLIRANPIVFTVVKLIGASYLGYMGFSMLRAKPNDKDINLATVETSQKRAFVTGFLTNALNPKVTLFLLMLFTSIISPATPLAVQALYGLYLCVATTLWFCFVSVIFSTKKVRLAFLRMEHWFERVMGVLLIVLAVKLVTAQL